MDLNPLPLDDQDEFELDDQDEFFSEVVSFDFATRDEARARAYQMKEAGWQVEITKRMLCDYYGYDNRPIWVVEGSR